MAEAQSENGVLTETIGTGRDGTGRERPGAPAAINPTAGDRFRGPPAAGVAAIKPANQR